MPASQPWPLLCLTFGKMPSELFRKCAGWTHNYNNAAEQPCQSIGLRKSHKTGKKWDRGITWLPLKMEMTASCFCHLGPTQAGSVTAWHGPILPSFSSLLHLPCKAMLTFYFLLIDLYVASYNIMQVLLCNSFY